MFSDVMSYREAWWQKLQEDQAQDKQDKPAKAPRKSRKPRNPKECEPKKPKTWTARLAAMTKYRNRNRPPAQGNFVAVENILYNLSVYNLLYLVLSLVCHCR